MSENNKIQNDTDSVRAYKQHFTEINDNKMAWYEWGSANPDKPTILLIHATGFHGRCWNQVVLHLQAQDRNRHIVAIDMRGHGQSGNIGPFTWHIFGEDIACFVETLDLKEIVAVGHSMGGYALCDAMTKQQSRFLCALLIDPVIMDPAIYKAGESQQDRFLNEAGEHPVARRRNEFLNAEAMFDNFSGRGSYGLWEEAVLWDYCNYGLSKAEGDYQLACPPEVEAAIYMGSTSNDLYSRLQMINVPVTVLRAEKRETESATLDFSKSPTWPALASQFTNGHDVYLPALSHFIPMQAPSLTAEYINKMCK